LSASDLCTTPCPFLIWCLTVVCGTVNLSLAVWDPIPRQTLIVTRIILVSQIL
jgi:hypothetical protein